MTTAALPRAARPPGTLLWHARLPGIGSLVATDGLLYVGVDQGVYAMHAHTGRKAWTHKSDAGLAPYAAQADVLFGVSIDGVVALRASDQLWERALSQAPGPLAATEDIVVVGSSHRVQALSAAVGLPLWSHAISAYPVIVTAADDVVYVAAMTNPLAAPDGADQLYAFQA